MQDSVIERSNDPKRYTSWMYSMGGIRFTERNIVSVFVINDILPLDSILLSYASVINAITSSERATVMAQINKLYYHRR